MNVRQDQDVRASMAVLPSFVQPFLTWLTGAPLAGSRPRLRWSPWARLLAYLLQTASGVGLAVIAVTEGGARWALLPVGWLLTSGGQRALYINVIHAAVHGAFSAGRRVNRWVGELLSTLLLVNGFDRFKEDHARWHHGKRLATEDDPDAQLIRTAGFGPGLSREDAWRRYGRALFSPALHGGFLRQRLRTNFREAPAYRIAMAVLFWGATLGLVTATGAWSPFLWAWGFPLVLLYQQSSLTQMLSEHRWFLGAHLRGRGNARLTFARHLGDRYPGRTAPPSARLRWWMRVLLVHLPLRLWVLVGSDLHVHDYHHRHPRGDWANAAHARQRDQAAGHPGWDDPYESVWGSLADHMNVVFDDWAASAEADR